MPSANDIKVQITGAKNLTWTGNASSEWAVGAGGPLNWTDLAAANERFFNADTTLFNDSGAKTVNLSANVLPGAVTFSNNSGEYVISGAGSIGGINGVLKQGSAPSGPRLLPSNGPATPRAGVRALSDRWA